MEDGVLAILDLRSSILGFEGSWLRFKGVQNAHLGVGNGVGEVVQVHLFDVRPPLLVVELLNEILLPLVNVDGFLMQCRERAGEIHLADDLWLSCHIEHHKVV